MQVDEEDVAEAYGRFFVRRPLRKASDALEDACRHLKVLYHEGCVAKDVTAEDFSREDLQSAIRKLRVFARKLPVIEHAWDVLSANGMHSRQDSHGLPIEGLEPIPKESQYMTAESFYRGLQRLNVRVFPKEVMRWMLHQLSDPEAKDLKVAPVEALLKRRWSWSDFARLVLVTGVFLSPTASS